MNMNQEIRRELRTLAQAKKTNWRERAADTRPLIKQMGELKRAYKKALDEFNRGHRKLWLRAARLFKQASKRQQKIDRRILVLQGRLT